MFVNVRNIMVTLICCMTITACSSVDYVRHPYGEKSKASVGDKSLKKFPKNFGALVTPDKIDPETGEKVKGHIVLLKRQKSRYMAEAELFDNSNVENAKFDRSYLSFGADHKKKQIGFKLRFEY